MTEPYLRKIGYAKMKPGIYEDPMCGTFFGPDGLSKTKVTQRIYDKLRAIFGDKVTLVKELSPTPPPLKQGDPLDTLNTVLASLASFKLSTDLSSSDIANLLNKSEEFAKPIHHLHVTNWLSGNWSIPDEYVPKIRKVINAHHLACNDG